MGNIIFKGFLIYFMCFLGITSFLIGGTRVSFADKGENESSRGSFQKSEDDGGGDDNGNEGGGVVEVKGAREAIMQGRIV